MAFTDPGPGSNLLAALATSIGFGLVVGGFVSGAVSFASTRSQKNAEKWSLIGGYFGGFIALAVRAADMVMRSFV